MGSTNGNGVGNLLISYKFKGEGAARQVDEELVLKNAIIQLLSERGYKFIIADDEFINEKLLRE